LLYAFENFCLDFSPSFRSGLLPSVRVDLRPVPLASFPKKSPFLRRCPFFPFFPFSLKPRDESLPATSSRFEIPLSKLRIPDSLPFLIDLAVRESMVYRLAHMPGSPSFYFKPFSYKLSLLFEAFALVFLRFFSLSSRSPFLFVERDVRFLTDWTTSCFLISTASFVTFSLAFPLPQFPSSPSIAFSPFSLLWIR